MFGSVRHVIRFLGMLVKYDRVSNTHDRENFSPLMMVADDVVTAQRNTAGNMTVLSKNRNHTYNFSNHMTWAMSSVTRQTFLISDYPQRLPRGDSQTVVKYMFFYSAVSTQSALHFTPWQTCSFRHQLDFSGKHSAITQLLHKNRSPTFKPPSIARYSFTQLSELGRHGEDEKGPYFKMAVKRILRLSHRAPRTTSFLTFHFELSTFLAA